MSVPVIGAAAVATAAPATPAAVPAQGALPFMLLPIATVAQFEPALTDAPPAVEIDEALPDDPDAPLIGWLFDSFALAATPPNAAPAPALPMSLGDAAQPLSGQPSPVAGAADVIAATVAEHTAAAPAQPTAFVADDLSPAPMPVIEAGVEIPPVVVPADPVAVAPTSTPDLIAPLASLLPVSAPTPTSAPAPIDGVMPPLVADDPALAAELGERIAWQLDQGIGEATIELHPAELGALTIRIETQAQQAQVHILAAEPAARALLSQCLPQLRDMLGASGLTMTRGQVEMAERRAESGVDLPTPRGTRRRVSSVTLVDTYA